MAMSDDRFRVIRNQLVLFELVDAHVTDKAVAQEMFDDARRLLRELVNAAEEGGVLMKYSPRVLAMVGGGLILIATASGMAWGYILWGGR